MSKYHQNRPLTDLIALEELRTTLPHVGYSLRILLPDGTSVWLQESIAPFDSLLQHRFHISGSANKRDARLLKESIKHHDVFLFSYPKGVACYAAPIFCGECFLGVTVSDSLLSDPTKATLEQVVDSPEASPEELDTIQSIASTDAKTIHNALQLAQAFLNHLASIGLQNEFLSAAFSCQDLDALLNLIVTEVPRLIPQTHCSVFLWNLQKNQFLLERTSNIRWQSRVGQVGYERGEGLTGWVGRYARPLLVRNVSDKHELAQFADEDANIPAPVWKGKLLDGEGRTSLLVPIRMDDKSTPIGVIRLSPQPPSNNLLTKQHLSLLSRLARLIYNAVQSAQLMRSMWDLALATGQGTSEDMLNVLMDQISQVTGSYSSHIRVLDETRNRWYLLAISNSPYKEAIIGKGAVSEGPLIHSIIQDGKPYHLNNRVDSDLNLQARLKKERVTHPSYADYLQEMGAALIVPLRDPNTHQILGMFNLHRRVGEHFEEHQIRLVKELALVLGRIINSLRLADQKSGEDAALHNVDVRGIAVLDKMPLFDTILQNAIDLIDCDIALVRELDQTTGKLKLIKCKQKAGIHFPAKVPDLKDIGEGGSGMAAKERRHYFIPNADSDPIYQEDRRKAEENQDESRIQFLDWLKSEISVPMLMASSLVGVLVVLSSVPDKFHPRDVDKMLAFAAKAAPVLYSLQLAENILHRQKQLQGILTAAQRMLVVTEEARMLRIALTATTHDHGLGFCRALILLRDKDVFRMKLPLARGAVTREQQTIFWARPIANHDLAYEESANDTDFQMDREFNEQVQFLILPNICVPDTAQRIRDEGYDWEKEILQALDCKTGVIAPIPTPQGTVGVIIADNKYLPHPIQQEDIDLLQLLAMLIGIIVTNLRYVAKETQVHIEAWKQIAARVAHMVGNRVDAVGTLLEILKMTLEQQPDMEEEVNDLIPSVKLGVEEAKQFLLDIRSFATTRPLQLGFARLHDLVRVATQQTPPFPDGLILELDPRIDQETPECWCDATELKYCITETLQNAREMGATQVIIRSRQLSEQEVEISLSNNGPAIPQEQQQKVFEPLFTTRKQGTGLGLAIVKRIIEQHQGTIFVDSKRQGGVCFVIRLPLLRPREDKNVG